MCPGLADTPLLGRSRSVLDALAYPSLTAADVSAVLIECATGERLDEVTVVQAGREPAPYQFAGVPGPGHAAATLPEAITLG